MNHERQERREGRRRHRGRQSKRRGPPNTSDLAEDLRDQIEDQIRDRLERTMDRYDGKPLRKRRSKLTAEERAYREAQRAVAQRIGFLAHLIPYAAVCLFLLFVAGFRPAMIVALAWGIGVASHAFFALVAPNLRRRWIEDEVSQRVRVDVSKNRRELEGRHARTIEHLSASIAHEIRNPITAAKSLVQQMGEDPRSRENVEYAGVALEELERVERSISHLLRYARDEEMSALPVQLGEVVDSALETLRERLDRTPGALHRDYESAGELVCDSEKLRRVVINLVGNALDALEGQESPTPRIEIEAGENLAGTEVWLRVRDNGPGIDPDRIDKIFTPFHTSKPNGTGLGLPITRKIVEAHGGGLQIESAMGEGTEFLITLPKNGGSEPEEAAS